MKKKCLAALVLAAFGMSAGGCSVEDGVAQGLTDGFSAIVTALIETPVQYWLDQQFGE